MNRRPFESELSPFLRGTPQEAISIRGVPSKLPGFYRDVRMMWAVLTADRRAAEALMPSGRIRPIRVSPGRTLMGITCCAFRDADVGDYNEVGISLAVEVDGRGSLGAAAARAIRRREYHAYVVQLPVNTELALHGGVDFFGYPKFLADIRFEEQGGIRTCTVRDEASGETIYSFSGRMLRTSEPASPIVTFFTYPMLNGRIVQAVFRVNMKRRRTSWGAGGFRLHLGDHPYARAILALKPGRLLQYVYVPAAEAILYAPQ